MFSSFEAFNTALLKRLSKVRRSGSDIKSILIRYQALSIIYLNLCSGFLTLIWNLIDYMGFPLPTFVVNLTIFPLLIISSLLLKEGKKELSTVAALGYFHLTVFFLSKVADASLSGLCITIVTTSCGFLLSSSKKVQFFNVLICVLQNIFIMYDIRETFKETLYQEQYEQVFRMQISSLMMVVLLALISYTQKVVETNLWQAAQTNYERAEKINKEVLQAIEAKDVFVSSLSHEIRNPLNAMKGSIDYLSRVVKDPNMMPMIENAKLSGEVLLNLVSNVLDAAKLKSDKMEVAHIETNTLDIIKKIAMIHFESLKMKDITARIYIDMNLPRTLWIDSSRMLQIMMNLFSNAIKFTPEGGNIQFYIVWCDDEESTEELQSPILEGARVLSGSSKDVCDEKQTDARSNERALSNIYLSKTDDDPSLESYSEKSIAEFKGREIRRVEDRLKGIRMFKTNSLKTISLSSIKVQGDFLVWTMEKTRTINTQELTDAYLSIEHRLNRDTKKGFIKVQVTDNGPGIPQNEVPKLFGMFSQANKDVGNKYGGTGLGLWICKQLCQKMGGEIAIYSEVNKGSTFLFYIPVDNQNLIENSSVVRASTRHGQQQQRVLIADDFAYNRDMHKLLFEREGVLVSLAKNGLEAFDKYKAQGDGYYDFIMMDIQMPEMDGFTTAKKIREYENQWNWRSTRIYFVSGEYYNEAEIMVEFRNKGHFGEVSGVRCLRKPIDVEAITEIVKNNSEMLTRLIRKESQLEL